MKPRIKLKKKKNVVQVDFRKPEYGDVIVERLENLIKDAKQGIFHGMVYCTLERDGRTLSSWVGMHHIEDIRRAISEIRYLEFELLSEIAKSDQYSIIRTWLDND